MLVEKIIIGADHAGFALKETLKPCLARLGLALNDIGTETADPVDYPDIGCRVAAGVSSGVFARGILICGSGVGMTIIANKYPRVRAALCLDEETAELSRRHNDTNILCLAGRRTDPEKAEKIIEIWLKTAFEGGRHNRRIEKIREIEKEVCNQQN
ncbi:MAG: ribose 5-phosphate isomerase B [Deltaproteobacteria bacterium HGW-Deltaproteobacteria-11]|nr:MAG: ribose 5-phosphate isomerase B [Deltaproteobacteria bacterium HGW-Deltaproteobacteria-11]